MKALILHYLRRKYGGNVYALKPPHAPPIPAAGLRMPPFSASLEDCKLRQLCWRVLYAARGLCAPVHYRRDSDVASIELEPMVMNG